MNRIASFPELEDVLKKQARDLQEIQERLQKQASSINNAMKPFFQRMKEINKAIEKTIENERKFSESFRKLTLQYNQIIAPPRALLDAIQNLPEEYCRNICKLADRGWYIHPDMPFDAPRELARGLEQDNGEKIDNALELYFQEKCEEIRVSLCCRYPARKSIFNDAFHVHDGERYNLSVPIFIIQTDGIFYDSFGKSLYIGKQRTNVINSHLDQADCSFSKIDAQILMHKHPLWQSSSERGSSFEGLNRHQILHGEVVDYGTRRNSLKTIAFLSWLNWVLRAPDH